MNDKHQIQEAYSAMVRLMFNVFFESFTAAHGNAEQERNAEDRFKSGLTHARHVRDRALALSQPDA